MFHPLKLWDCAACGLTLLHPIPRPEEYPGGGDWFSPQKRDLSRQYGFRHGWHTFLFTGQTLGRCLEVAGFEVLDRPRRAGLLDDILILWGRKKG